MRPAARMDACVGLMRFVGFERDRERESSGCEKFDDDFWVKIGVCLFWVSLVYNSV